MTYKQAIRQFWIVTIINAANLGILIWRIY
jgi:hypothetical protein